MSPRVALLPVLLLLACDYPPPPEPPPPATAPDDATLLAQRPVTVQLPLGYDASTPYPLVVALHGYGNEPAEMNQRFHYGSLGRSMDGGYLYVAPPALKDRLGYTSWHPAAKHAAPWDVEYLLAVVKDVSAHYAVDPKRITFIGFSQGAHMAHRMACDGSELVSGIISIAGQVTKISTGCAPPHPVSVLQVHGTADEAIGYYGDINVPGDPSIPSAHETVGVWAYNDHCTGALVKTGVTMDLDQSQPGDETFVEAYEGCPPGVAVELWTMQGSTHGPPATADFAALTYAFLRAHPRP